MSLLLAGAGWALDTEFVPTTDTSKPFARAVQDFAASGYLEDEYFVAGTANVYEYDVNLDVQVQSTDMPYTARIMVRRPAEPADFNGVVVFEMMNPPASWDIDFIWYMAGDWMMDEGYIWIGQTI